jgi:hypothetical protein
MVEDIHTTYAMAIMEIVIFLLVAIYAQNIWLLSAIFIVKCIQILGITNYDKITDKETVERVKTYIYYLKENGVFSFLHISDQIVSFGSIFCIAVIVDQRSESVNIFFLLFMSFISGIYWLINNNMWNTIKSTK